MILLSMPCPPMPMLMSKEVMDEVSFVHVENVPCNSHDLLAHLLNKAAAGSMCGKTLNPRRAVYQTQATDTLNQRFDDWKLLHPHDEVPPLDTSYGFFMEFSRAYIQSYMQDPTQALDIRFVPATDVDTGTHIHTKCLDFAKWVFYYCTLKNSRLCTVAFAWS
jgi:hypothetical protein